MQAKYLAEPALLSVALALAMVLRRAASRSAFVFETFRRIAAHRRRAVAICFFAAILVRVAVLPMLPIPLPTVHDEFSQLLLAKTLVRGRLTNPPHPLWQHFETFHENMLPTYQSMYPPGQALFLAAGVALSGEAFWGVLLGCALMCAAICWALQAFAPSRWAMLGALYVVFRYGIANYWSDSYFGGAVAALGGALVLGGAARLLRNWRTRDAVAVAGGLLLLANTRPYEGLFFALPSMMAVIVGVWYGARAAARPRAMSIAVLAAVLATGFAWMGYYNWRGTGHALVAPYIVNFRTYHLAGPFFGEHATNPPQYRQAEMARHYERSEVEGGRPAVTLRNFVRLTGEKAATYYPFLLAPLTCFVLLGMIGAEPSRRWALPVTALFSVGLASAATIYLPNPHYLAPALIAILAMALRGMRILLVRAKKVGREDLAVSFLALYATLVAIVYGANMIHILRHHEVLSQAWARERLAVEQHFAQQPEPALLLVRYSESHPVLQEWVYNGPEIDAQRVVWAHSMGAEEDRELIGYYPHRAAWMVEVAADKASYSPYSETTQSKRKQNEQ